MLENIRKHVANMQYGKLFGIVFSMFGAVILLLELSFISNSGQYHPKFLISSIFFLGMGLTFFIFSGGKFSKSDYPNVDFDAKTGFMLLWNQAPQLHKIIWVVAAIVFIIIAFWVENQLQRVQ